MTTIASNFILASRNTSDPLRTRVLATLKARYPLWIHQELLTHRAFSKNTASSRAIPIGKMIEEAENDPAMPIYWTKNQTGMQGYTYLNKIEEAEAISTWNYARDDAVKHARTLARIGCHKQIANRLLGPYIHVTAVISATEWSNFDWVRTHHTTEPHMRDLAIAIKDSRERAIVQDLNPGQWHLPFITKDDMNLAHKTFDDPEFGGGYEDLLLPLSTARCASVSYKTVEDLDMTSVKAHDLYRKLVVRYAGDDDPIHASPAEHPAQADECVPTYEQISKTHDIAWLHSKDHRNFVGFRQHRADIKGDTR
jgi:hypothetical protein